MVEENEEVIDKSAETYDDQKRYYDLRSEQEWERLDGHRTEFALTMCALVEHLPPAPARVLDCGGGPGRYAIELTKLGYQVTLFDLPKANLHLAEQKAAQAGVTLAGYQRGTATDLALFANDTFDAVLLMGPLYHLLEGTARLRALQEAHRVLKPGGTLFAAFIARYAPLRHTAAHQPTWPLEHPDLLQTILESGCLPPRGEAGASFVAHFTHPTEVDPLCQAVGFELATLLGMEGLVSMIETEVNALSGQAWESWVNLNYRLAPDPSIHGCVEHLLAVATKPRWRTVLRQIARRLNEAGVSYQVAGGASIALQGAPLAVVDLDLETDVAGAYRFQALFADRVREPVTLRESRLYRSHFGRFDFGGTMVEVMGDLQRREGEEWVATATTTTTTVDLDGVPVSTSWLEEETLAYIRRGRLDRAARCLPYCNHERLLALLR